MSSGDIIQIVAVAINAGMFIILILQIKQMIKQNNNLKEQISIDVIMQTEIAFKKKSKELDRYFYIKESEKKEIEMIEYLTLLNKLCFYIINKVVPENIYKQEYFEILKNTMDDRFFEKYFKEKRFVYIIDLYNIWMKKEIKSWGGFYD